MEKDEEIVLNISSLKTVPKPKEFVVTLPTGVTIKETLEWNLPVQHIVSKLKSQHGLSGQHLALYYQSPASKSGM